MCWVAKNSITGEVLSKFFDSIYDCQKYIDKNIDNKKLLEDYKKDYKEENREEIKKDFIKLPKNSIIKICLISFEDYLDMVVDFKLCFKSDIVRCYNVFQQRFADSFDF